MAFRIEWCSENRIATIWMEMTGGVNNQSGLWSGLRSRVRRSKGE